MTELLDEEEREKYWFLQMIKKDADICIQIESMMLIKNITKSMIFQPISKK